jgi:DNA-binding NarL/FixJ family response regulator
LAAARLLLVDDDDSVLSGLGVVLDAYEFAVTTAANVPDALRLIASSDPFDVLLTDLHMPGAGDGLVVAAAMRHINPNAVTLVLSANPDLPKAAAAIIAQVDQVLVKPVKVASLVELIHQRLSGEMPRRTDFTPELIEPHPDQPPAAPAQPRAVELVARIIEHERPAITDAWLAKMREAHSMSEIQLSTAEWAAHLPDALNEVVYRLQYPQPLGLMTLFSMAALQHGARRRRQGFRSPVLVEEARALQVVLFQTVQENIDRMDLSQLPATLMAIADEVNAQLLQSHSGYENEKPTDFPR